MLFEIYKKDLKENIFKIFPKTFRQLTQFIQIKPLPIQNFKHCFAKLEKKQSHHLEKSKDNFLIKLKRQLKNLDWII